MTVTQYSDLASPTSNSAGQTVYTFQAISQGMGANLSVSVPSSPYAVQWIVAVGGQQVGATYGSAPFGPMFVAGGQAVSLTGTLLGVTDIIEEPLGENLGLYVQGPACLVGYQGSLGEISPANPTGGGGPPQPTMYLGTTNVESSTVTASSAAVGLLLVGPATAPTVSVVVGISISLSYTITVPVAEISGSGDDNPIYIASPIPGPSALFGSYALELTLPGAGECAVWEIDNTYPFVGGSGGGGGTTINSVSSFINTNVNISAGTATEITSVDLPKGTWLVSAQVLTGTSGGQRDIWVGANSASTTGALGASSDFNISGGYTATSLVCTVVLASATTLYLNAEPQSGVSLTALAKTPEASAPGATGLVAIQLA